MTDEVSHRAANAWLARCTKQTDPLFYSILPVLKPGSGDLRRVDKEGIHPPVYFPLNRSIVNRQMTCIHSVTARSLAPPTPFTRIYKDECVLCFATPHSNKSFNVDDGNDSQEGLRVCLTCFQGFCKEHVGLHFEKIGHPLVLHVQCTTHVDGSDREKENPASKLQRLEIKAEEQQPEEHYAYSVCCLACAESSLDETNEAIKNTSDAVIKAVAARKRIEVQAWSDKPVECVHTANPETPRDSVSTIRRVCTECSIDSNLWCCIACGVVGCGRAQWDGSGGKGHAMQHYTATRHPLAVKLGTVDPSDPSRADTFCYPCDELRACHKLKDALPLLGLSHAAPYERSMAELNVEQNVRFDFSMADADGQQYPLASGRGFLGLRNLGNSCYMASVLQSLLALSLFSDRVLPEGHVRECPVDPPACLRCQLAKIGVARDRGLHVAPWMFTAAASAGHAEFASSRQQDAMEFLSHFLSSIARIDRTTANTELSAKTASLFELGTQECIRCVQCGEQRFTKPARNMAIVLNVVSSLRAHPEDVVFARREGNTKPIVSRIPFSTCLADYFAGELVDLRCSTECPSKRAEKRTVALSPRPPYLIVQVGRFTMTPEWTPAKLDDVEITECMSLDISPFMGTEQSDSNDTELVKQLVEMGFPRNVCIQAAGQCTDVESAMTWILAQPSIDPEQLHLLIGAGFGEDEAVDALRHCEGSAERAIEHLLSRPPASTTNEGGLDDSSKTSYTLRAFVSHRGPSAHCGHYVAHVLINGKWTLCNDDRLAIIDDAKTIEQAASQSYLLFYQRDDL